MRKKLVELRGRERRAAGEAKGSEVVEVKARSASEAEAVALAVLEALRAQDSL